MSELTHAALAAATATTVLRDKTVTGLHTRGKRFFLYFRTKGGVERRPKLGEFPTITVAQARQLAKDMLLEVAKGLDPVAERQIERAVPTLEEAIDRYEREYAPKRKRGDAAVKLLRKYLQRQHGTKKISAISHQHLHALHADMRATPVLANRVVQHASKLFNLCVVPWGYRTSSTDNPCKGIERYPEKKRKRYMKSDEAMRVAERLDHYKAKYPAAVAFIYLLILAGPRPGEISAAEWSWLDGNVLHFPDSKTGEKEVYLPAAAMEVIDALPRTSTHILGMGAPHKLWYRVRQEAQCPDLRLYDLRHSFASSALAAGLSLSQIGELLGHSSTQTTKRYAHLIDTTAQAAVAKTAALVTASLRGHTHP